VVTSASNERQLKALADRVEVDVKKKFKKLALGVEGKTGGQWVLVDYGDIVIHIFLDIVRDFYRLEDLWHDAPLLKF
jgi:ribosome-associated protein